MHHQKPNHPKVSPLVTFGFIALLVFGNAFFVAGQITYYVASSGNDGNGGRSADNAFQSLNKVNSLTLQPGDQVLFRRGDTFRGTLLIRQSGNAGQPITIDAFGSGNKPVLTGAVPVTNWSNVGNNTWQANIDLGSRTTGVYKNGSALPLGRYPNLNAANRGYLTIQSHTGKGKLDSKDDLGGIDWTGGEAVMRSTQWIMDRATITQQNGKSLNLSNNSSYDIADGFGFFIQNHPATLDQPGEWYYNPANKTLRIYDSSDPNGQTITATAYSEAVNLNGVSNVTLRNLQLTQALSTNLLINNGSGITLSGVEVTNAGEDGVLIKGSGNAVLMENGLIQDVNNNGFAIGTYQNVTFRGNTMQRIGLVPGRGKSGDGTYTGFQSASNTNTLIENNVIDQIGYNGVNFANNTTLQRNRVSNFCVTKSDGGGLYIWNGNHQAMSGVRLLNNIVFNGIGTAEGTPGGAYSGANGIYLDDCTTNIEVTGNTVFNCKGLGIYLHGSSAVQLKNNTSYNNGEAQLSMTSIPNSCSPNGNVIQNNVFVSRTTDQLVAKYESHLNDLGNYGQYSNNVYARPFDDNNKIRIVYGVNGNLIGADRPLADWQSRSGQDAGSTNSPITYNPAMQNPNDYLRLEYNDTGSDKTISLGGNYRDARNTLYTNQITLAAFTSVVLLKVDSPPPPAPLRDPENPANAVVGLDYSYYEGAWGQVSDLTGVTPIKSGQTGQPDLGQRNREENFGLKFTGYINIPTDGQYTFYTYSDDGSKLYIGTTQVVDNDFGHAEQERSGTIGLKAGRHAITIPYLQGGGGKALSVSYSGPGTGKQVIPASAFYRIGTPPPPPPANLRDPENPSNAVVGLDYSYYEGAWGQVSDLTGVTPIKSGQTGQPDLSQRNREDNFGLKFTGYINIPTDGQYTFYTYSDDGSKLYIGTTQVVDNDFGHAEQERSGTIGLKAGRHAITIPYLQGGGGKALSVSYSGPGIDKQIIPAGAFFRVGAGSPPPASNLRDPENPANAVNGLDYGYYEGSWSQLPEFSTLTSVKSGQAGQPDLSQRNREDNFGLLFKGYVNVPTDGQYTFYTYSDDGSKLYIGTTQVVDNDGGHPEQERSGSIGLKAGKHAISIPYFEGGGGQNLVVSYSGPGIGKQTIPASAFYRVGGGSPPPAGGTGTGLLGNYFNNKTLTAPSVLSRTDATIDFNWDTNSPANGISVDNFSIRWSGLVEAPVSGNYVFTTTADDGVRLWVNNNLVIDNWNDHPPTTDNSQGISLVAGQKYAIRMEYYESAVGAMAQLKWSYPGQGQQVIPQVRLYPGSASSRIAADSEPVVQSLTQEVTSQVQVYPIPAQHELTVKFLATEAGEANLQLNSLAGISVLKQTHPHATGQQTISVPVRDIPRGYYLLTLLHNNQRTTRKVLLVE
ncbi:PA14 domain-containing protein [Fibrella aquatilis]|uniref:Right-handed parallel beta-helix repeat-containing protein n=1 Tax=Fibrella aquatilis TaxID=2817059 RepID=A0A939JY12_9BACT|nr:PA14 domain-containing protein [Fibrella aquatilis]MBO0929396.1 right-handed parallel beta-helix repeat-containing protein [Fibrella aquatilis]